MANSGDRAKETWKRIYCARKKKVDGSQTRISFPCRRAPSVIIGLREKPKGIISPMNAIRFACVGAQFFFFFDGRLQILEHE